LTEAARAWLDRGVLLVLARVLDALLRPSSWASLAASAKTGLRYMSEHTGVPALVVAAILLAIGYRILRRSARFLLEVAVLGVALFVCTELGWIRW
jgi:hypothetical protein